MSECPCGSGKTYAKCCELVINNQSVAKSPEALMRARYSAFVKAEIPFLIKSHHADTNSDVTEESLRIWAENSKWHGLEICNATGNEVEFIAKYEVDGALETHHELATFKQVENVWYFYDGQVFRAPVKRASAKVGRNDPCPCGSGKKFKKCCA